MIKPPYQTWTKSQARTYQKIWYLCRPPESALLAYMDKKLSGQSAVSKFVSKWMTPSFGRQCLEELWPAPETVAAFHRIKEDA